MSALGQKQTLGPLLGRRLRRIPDGKPGSRRLWVSFQYPLLRSIPFLSPDPSGALRKTSGFPYRSKDYTGISSHVNGLDVGSLTDVGVCQGNVRLRFKADVIGYDLATRPAFVVCFRVGSHRFL
jgi:hypothetical protein